MTTALSLEGVRAIAASLPPVMAEPGDLDARSQLLYGAYLSGVALATTSAGLHHKITHVLGGTFNLVHADAHSVVLPHAVAFNAPVLPVEMARLAEALGTPGEDPAGACGTWRRHRTSRRRSPRSDSERDQLPEAAARAAAEITDNPRPVDEADLLGLLERAFDGRTRRRQTREDDNREPRELPRRRRPHTDRPDRRRARRCAARRPGRDRGARRCPNDRPTSIPPRSTRRTSATPTRRARTTATSPGWRCCWRACRRRSRGRR